MRTSAQTFGLATLLATTPLVAQDSAADETASGQAQETPTVIPALDFSNLLETLRTTTPAYDPSKPVVGFGLQRNDGKIRIAQVVEGSAAEKAGLKVDMIILRINGLGMDPFTLPEVIKILGAIDGEINLDIEGAGRFSLIKAPIEQTKE